MPKKHHVTLSSEERDRLNMAKSELSILARQCLDARIPDLERLRREVTAWKDERNQNRCRTNWRFKTEDARIRLARLYPSFEA